MATLVDTNVLIDLFEVGGTWEAWSTAKVYELRKSGPLVLNQLIYAEMAAGFIRETDLDDILPPSKFVREHIPWNAAFLAGRAFTVYKATGGTKRSPLPDFYIGAHALIAGHCLLTRDPARYRRYFPGLDVIAPDTHP